MSDIDNLLRMSQTDTLTSFLSLNNFSGSGDEAVKRISTRTRFINGKKMTTKKIFEIGRETTMTYENDVLVSKIINRVPQPITAMGQTDVLTSFASLNIFSGAGSEAVKRTSTRTRFINGKKMTTKKIFENGRETTMTYENDVLVSKIINRVPQPITAS